MKWKVSIKRPSKLAKKKGTHFITCIQKERELNNLKNWISYDKGGL